MICFEHMGVRYDGAAAPVLREVNLRVEEGELCLVIGPTGSGKSTLLAAVNGLVPYFTGGTLAGRVVVGGRDTARFRPRELADVVGVVGQDPLAGFGDTAGEHLRRHDSFPHCPDILVNGVYDPQTREVAPFEEFMGSHGGLGGQQTKPFALVPVEWREPGAPIVGVEAMHGALMRWLAESGPQEG